MKQITIEVVKRQSTFRMPRRNIIYSYASDYKMDTKKGALEKDGNPVVTGLDLLLDSVNCDTRSHARSDNSSCNPALVSITALEYRFCVIDFSN